MKREIFKIKGMHCASCAMTIQKAVGKMQGVKSAQVNYGSETAMIEYDEEKNKPEDFAKTVYDAGYKLEIPSSAKGLAMAVGTGKQLVSFKVVGMDSAHCAMAVENAVKTLPGVESVNVDFNSARAKIVFDPGKIQEPEIEKVIREAGYRPIKETAESDDVLEKEKKEREKEVSDLKKKIIVGGALSLFVFLGSFPEWFSFWPKTLQNPIILFLLATPVQFWVGSRFYRGLILLFKYRTADMNTLIAIGTLAAYFYSTAAAFAGKGVLYFDTSAVIITLILLGRYFEAMAKGRASEAIKKLMKLGAKTARVIKDGKEIEVAVEEVVVGDMILVRPGEKIPVDGEVLEGKSSIDESLVTGESMPQSKEPGEKVIGSTINLSGVLTFKATKVGKETLLAQIIKMVEQAQASKAPIQRLADLVSSYFVPAVIAIAIITFIVWWIFGPSPAFTFALVNFVAVLIIACPCALGLATPLAIMVGSGNAAQRGILVRDAEALEIAHKIKAIILDKTGTLTKGKPELIDIVVFSQDDKNEVLQLAASLEYASEHPLAKAIVEKAKKENLEFLKVENFEAISGKGVKGDLIINGERFSAIIGNRILAQEESLVLANIESELKKLEEEGKTAMILAVDKKARGIFAVADALKEESIQAVASLKKEGLDVWMLTGDNETVAKAIAKKVGIENIMAQVLPQNKAEKVKELQNSGKLVAMVGDGINDAPALAQADLGIAMGEGTDIAMESSEITLMRGDLRLIPEVISLSRKTLTIIKQNLFWAFFYNVAFIPVAAGALYPFWGILLNPIFAAAAMAFSSLSVVLNSLRLKRA